jgi:hypothetical protein
MFSCDRYVNDILKSPWIDVISVIALHLTCLKKLRKGSKSEYVTLLYFLSPHERYVDDIFQNFLD